MAAQQPEGMLLTARYEFVQRVPERAINRMVDLMLGERIINDQEMDMISGVKDREERARQFIDIVRKKGDGPSLRLITVLRAEYPSLHHELGLDKP